MKPWRISLMTCDELGLHYVSLGRSDSRVDVFYDKIGEIRSQRAWHMVENKAELWTLIANTQMCEIGL